MEVFSTSLATFVFVCVSEGPGPRLSFFCLWFKGVKVKSKLIEGVGFSDLRPVAHSWGVPLAVLALDGGLEAP